MAYDTEELKQKAISAIKEHKLLFIDDLVSYLPCSKQTFYDHKLDKLDEIKELMMKNRVEIKNSLRAKWYKSDNATLQLALYKIIGSEHEAHRLNGSRQEIKQETTYKHEPVQMTAEEAKKYLDSADIA
jgi:hypothetical protein